MYNPSTFYNVILFNSISKRSDKANKNKVQHINIHDEQSINYNNNSKTTINSSMFQLKKFKLTKS